MTIHLTPFWLCWAICLAVTGWGFLPVKQQGSDMYGVGALFSAVFRLAVIVVTWLATWLVYFALLR